MNIYYCSDLHLEFKEYRLNIILNTIPNKDKDILILAGDIGLIKDFNQYIPWLEHICDKFYKVIYIFGNHEWYGIEYHNFSIKTDISNLVLVPKHEVIKLKELNIIGTTLWSSLNENDWITTKVLQETINDFSCIKGFNTTECYKLYQQEFNFIVHSVRQSIHENKKFIIVTHFSPIDTTDDRITELNHYFSNRTYLDLIEHIQIDYIKFNNLYKGWIYGHSHKPVLDKYIVYKMFSNQYGYRLNHNFTLQHIEIN